MVYYREGTGRRRRGQWRSAGAHSHRRPHSSCRRRRRPLHGGADLSASFQVAIICLHGNGNIASRTAERTQHSQHSARQPARIRSLSRCTTTPPRRRWMAPPSGRCDTSGAGSILYSQTLRAAHLLHGPGAVKMQPCRDGSHHVAAVQTVATDLFGDIWRVCRSEAPA